MEQDPRWNPTTVNFKEREVCIYREKGSECFVVRDNHRQHTHTHTALGVRWRSQKREFLHSGFEVIPSMKAQLTSWRTRKNCIRPCPQVMWPACDQLQHCGQSTYLEASDMLAVFMHVVDTGVSLIRKKCSYEVACFPSG